MTANKPFGGDARRRGGGGRQEAALAYLISLPTHKAAAEAAGVSQATMQRWLREPLFAERYQQAKAELVDGMTKKLRTHGLEAVEMLREVATDKEAPSAARVTAAARIIEFTLRAHETEDISVRLEKLEAERNGGDDDAKF
jgi:DNA-binding MurR/RpiR family transcriptional regulator